MRHLLHFGLFALALTAVTQADAQDGRRSDRRTTVVVARGGGPIYGSRRAYLDQQQDLEQIVSIAKRWERATANRDRRAQSIADRRLDAWLEREIRESIRESHNHGYTQRVHLLRNELAVLDRRVHHGRGHGAYHVEKRGRGHGDYYMEKARILDELVQLSERQVHRTRVNVRRPSRMSFAYR